MHHLFVEVCGQSLTICGAMIIAEANVAVITVSDGRELLAVGAGVFQEDLAIVPLFMAMTRSIFVGELLMMSWSRSLSP